RNQQHHHARESHLPQLFVGWLHIRALLPWTASAVDHHFFVVRNFCDGFFQARKAFSGRCWAGENRSRNVPAVVENFESDLQNQRPRVFWSIEPYLQFRRRNLPRVFPAGRPFGRLSRLCVSRLSIRSERKRKHQQRQKPLPNFHRASEESEFNNQSHYPAKFFAAT